MPPKKQSKSLAKTGRSSIVDAQAFADASSVSLGWDTFAPGPEISSPKPPSPLTSPLRMSADSQSPRQLITRIPSPTTPPFQTLYRPASATPPLAKSIPPSPIPILLESPIQSHPSSRRASFAFINPPTVPVNYNYDAQNMDNTGLSGYGKSRRELLDVLKSLHSTGVQNELDLPQIVVVGSQSVGKSSLIESMSGLSLPRDSGTCTRCPMECKLQQGQIWSCSIMLRFSFDSAGSPLMDVREVPFGETLYDKKDVVRMIARAQRAILRPTLDATVFLDDSDLGVLGHPAQTFSENCVCIHVTGPHVPDLYFYDLPGIIANVKDGENEADIQLVERLAKSYINKPNCIVLLVISCETDFENQGAGRLVLKNSELRRRTVGVLTKIDRIEYGGTSRWLRILRNEENKLKNGWFCVKQPDIVQLQAGISWEDAREAEREFFRDTAPWATLERTHRLRLGSGALAEHLGTVLSRLAALELPGIQDKISRQLHIVKEELSEMNPPDFKDPRREIINLLRDFNKKLTKHIEGLPSGILQSLPHQVSNGSSNAGSLIYTLHEAFERFRVDIHRTAPAFRPWSSKDNIGSDLTKQLIACAAEDDAVESRNINKLYLDQVWEFAKKSRTRELPGNYPFSVKQALIVASVQHWKGLAEGCFKEVQEIVTNHVEKLIEEHFARYAHGGLLETVVRVAREQIYERAVRTSEKIENLCHSENEPYTQNEHYFFNNQTKLLQRYRMIHRRSVGQGELFATLREHDPLGRQAMNPNWGYINNIISDLANLGIHGVVAEDLAKMFHKDDMEPALEIMAEVRAYFQVAYKRFTDNVPKEIDTDFVRVIDTDLDLALRYLDLSEAQCREWLKEPPPVTDRRNELTGKKNRLDAAQAKLTEFFRSNRPDLA